ncbi:hypothetical protein BU24DRAFT_194073 [Aaosphaeria arxii CBS 175.79]|uniref:Uncharacterized protein n=1 Tax=Aaosphaeria arxii CBS 175.79 TaxID=1450172 RepID=A0A6A5XTR5_9PLEO|nr:uncharacterized protein BU24DRAFT_194073 [Aaosphaeria arxii CBS 175.79]KAF2016111.1 hypothetical protein BU24DRAFT_194073 [Aaosphaeria arxii CBS 175.79]
MQQKCYQQIYRREVARSLDLHQKATSLALAYSLKSLTSCFLFIIVSTVCGPNSAQSQAVYIHNGDPNDGQFLRRKPTVSVRNIPNSYTSETYRY